MKKWIIYRNGIREGQADKLNEVFKRIETLAGLKLTNWDVRSDEVVVTLAENKYTAKKEEVD